MFPDKQEAKQHIEHEKYISTAYIILNNLSKSSRLNPRLTKAVVATPLTVFLR